MGGLDVSNLKESLPTFLQEMVDDVSLWFKHSQRWRLVDLSTGFINRERVRQALGQDTQKKKTEPDQFSLVLHFDSDSPPMTRGWFRSPRVNFPQVFSPDLDVEYHPWSVKGADVFPNKVGPVFPLKRALKELTSPYYLLGSTVYLNKRAPFEDKKGEQPKSLMAIIYTSDLVDYLRLEEAKIRQDRRRLDRNLTSMQSMQ